MMRQLLLRLAWMLSILVCAPVASARMPQYPGLTPEDAALQKSAIEAERRTLFHQAWALASEDRRASVRALLERHARDSSSQRDQPDLALLALATRILRGAEGARVSSDPLTRLADGIDLFCSPVDLKAQVGPEEGQVITVGVRLLEPVSQASFPAPKVRLRLAWIGLDGSRIEARGGEFGREEFNLGFPIALRTPPRASGRWQLFPSLEHEGQTVEGWPVSVPFVTRFLERVARLQAGDRVMGELSYLLKWGRIWVRRYDRLGPAEWLRRMEAGEVGGTLWSADIFVPRADPTRPLVLLVAASGESAASLLAGPSGAAWIAAAALHDFHLACADAKQMVGTAMQSTLADLVQTSGSKRVILVARGDAALGVNLSLPQVQSPNLVGMALVNSFGAPSSKITSVPTLLIGCSGEPARDPGHVTRLEAPRTLLLADTELPALFLPWFQARWPK